MVASFLVVIGIGIDAASAEKNIMNQGGVPYEISNPPGSVPDWKGQLGSYSTNFNNNVKGPVEHFDVYGEVQTKYSQVYWTRNAPINLPPELVSRFDGKTMAITGYEIDQVTHAGPQDGSTTSGGQLGGFSCYPDCSDTDKSVPIYHAYNHHYFSWLNGKDSEMYEKDQPTFTPNPTSTGFRRKVDSEDSGYPTNIVFKENPGGEYRKSYHGYPSGYAQLIHSPTQWIVEPMQIDTHNRDYGINDQVGYKPSFLPQQFHNSTQTDLEHGLSPLIECPCSTRIIKKIVNASSILTTGMCSANVDSEAACTAAVKEVAKVSSSRTVNNMSLPAGCIMTPDHAAVGSYEAVFNSARSRQPCGNGDSTALEGEMNDLVKLSIAHDGHAANISMTGPDGAWFGIGFGATTMADLPYAIIVDGHGTVTERKLANHGPGVLLKASTTVLKSTVSAGMRTVWLSRPVAGATKDHFAFPTAPGVINTITAVGNTVDLAYHKARTGGKIVLLPTKQSSCICAPQQSKYISYMNESSMQFAGYNCFDEPRSDMLRHGDGTGRSVPNAACHMETYHGGLQCCKHSWFLTDVEQDAQIPNKTDTYFLKWRYYFQEYLPQSDKATASHQHLHHWVFLIDEQINDYEEDNAHYGQGSIGKITAHLKAKDMGLEDIPKNYTKITPLVMTPHCHAPSCIREELWNADTGGIICNATTAYGDEKYGPTSAVFNEANYVTIHPCIYGYQPGLQTPFSLAPETNLLAIKYFNNTFRHLGQMAQWTGLMVYDTDPFMFV